MRILPGAALLVVACVSASAHAPAPAAQQAPAPRLISPDVRPDRTVTFRMSAPNAREVILLLEGSERRAMQKDAQGVWSITTTPLEPDYYGYSFIADGVRMIDPLNWLMKPNLLNPSSMVHVPGPASLPWERADAPRGAVHRHFYKSQAAGDERDFFVYTPPGYDPSQRRSYPVLYLLHGFSDDASGWTSVGQAHVILDNLIAQGKARPMLVVMPLGYGTMQLVSPRAAPGLQDPALRAESFSRFRDALLDEVIPFVEKNYRASTDASARAIAGLSMGGAESLYVGLNAPDRFTWIGAFSSGGLGEDLDATFPSVDQKSTARLRLLWIACGTEDRLIDSNRKIRERLTSKQIRHVPIETPGAHTWMVWRRNLAAFLPLIFAES
jgi:enterochelin esterase family protein